MKRNLISKHRRKSKNCKFVGLSAPASATGPNTKLTPPYSTLLLLLLLLLLLTGKHLLKSQFDISANFCWNSAKFSA